LTSKNGTKGLQKNTLRLFLEVTPENIFMIFVGENLWAKIAQKLFGRVWGYLRKILRTPKNLPAPTPMMKRHLCLHCPLLKGRKG